MAADLTAEALLGWVDRYEQVWRSDPGGARLASLFARDVAYLTEPYAEPLVGLDDLRTWWARESTPGELFTMEREVVAWGGPAWCA